ncbi:MAG: hypothetical protein V4473_02390 [Patescibacteria group bacterium]
MYRTLTQDGRPVKPGSFFIGIRREVIKHIDFVQVLNQSLEVHIPVRFLGRWEDFKGVVTQVNHFCDGMVVILKPTPKSLLENWPSAEIWIPHCIGNIGVLS